MAEYETLEDVLNTVKEKLNNTTQVKLSVIFANNTVGKTRLSKLFDEQNEEETLCYNAFLEDFFSWDNEHCIFKLAPHSWVINLIEKEGLDRQITDNFQQFTGSKIEPSIDLTDDESQRGNISFHLIGGEHPEENIKISKGEESVFIWSVFYTILSAAINNLIEASDVKDAEPFDRLKYIIIDDPVSSMDDTRIIIVALALNELIETVINNQEKLTVKLKFLVTTHHALFFNIIHGKDCKYRKQEDYLLNKADSKYILNEQKSCSPFAYHHQILLEIKRAIDNNNLRRYHFNLLRCLFEKTANFLGYSGKWSILLESFSNKDIIARMLNHYSHSQLSETEPAAIAENDKLLFIETFNTFITKFNWNLPSNQQ